MMLSKLILRKELLLFITSLLSCAAIAADFPEEENAGYSVYIDQDLFGADFAIKKNDDRDYTMGVEVNFGGSRVRDFPLHKWLFSGLDTVVHGWGLGPDVAETGAMYHTAAVGDTAFTPNDIGSSFPVYNDRPYANLLYLTASKLQYVEGEGSDNDFAVTNKLIVGALGLDIGKAVQTSIHEWTDGIRPRGWDYQISEGGELTLLYSRRSHHLWMTTEGRHWKRPEISWYWEGTVGYLTELAAGVQVRLGRVNSPFYAHTSNPLSSTNQNGFVTNDSYGFLSFGTRLVGYNALIQGQFRDSEVTFSGSRLHRMVGTASLGYTHDFDRFKMTYALNYRSSQFKSGLGDREHWFGGLYFSFKPRGGR